MRSLCILLLAAGLANGYSIKGGQQQALFQQAIDNLAFGPSRADYLEPPPAPAPEPASSDAQVVQESELTGAYEPQTADNGVPYAFAYDTSADSFSASRSEQSNGKGKVTGHYSISGADGTQRVVHYVADQDGFRASVQTNEPGTESQNPSGILLQSSQLPASEISRQYGPGEPDQQQAEQEQEQPQQIQFVQTFFSEPTSQQLSSFSHSSQAASSQSASSQSASSQTSSGQLSTSQLNRPLSVQSQSAQPIQSQPIQQQLIHSQPIHPQPIHPQPIQQQSIQQQSIQQQSIQHQSIQHQSIQQQSIQQQPIQSQPTQPQPIQSQPIQQQPIQQQPIQSQPIQPLPVQQQLNQQHESAAEQQEQSGQEEFGEEEQEQVLLKAPVKGREAQPVKGRPIHLAQSGQAALASKPEAGKSEISFGELKSKPIKGHSRTAGTKRGPPNAAPARQPVKGLKTAKVSSIRAPPVKNHLASASGRPVAKSPAALKSAVREQAAKRAFSEDV